MEKVDDRWNHIRKILERSGPFCHPDFEPSPNNITFLQEACKILVVGAGGLGCELLKNLVLLGFRDIHVIDMDIIDISNLNRQFLFRLSDVGKAKAEVAAAFINKRVQGTQVIPHFAKIQDKDESFYRQFHIIACGLDSITARRWLNGTILSLVKYSDDGIPDQSTFIPMVDGGTEGFKGNARVIVPTMTPCIECTLDLFPPQVNFPLCTIAHTPRLPEHCIEYVRIIQWPKENPFDCVIDGDDPNHISWIYEKALERGGQYNITGVTHRLTQGVVKRIIPAVASTNAIISAACATEILKLATSCCAPLNNYMVFNDVHGIYTYAYEAEKNEDCIACCLKVKTLTFKQTTKLQEVIDFLIENPSYQMKSPGITGSVNGKQKTLYMSAIESTKSNLDIKLIDLGITNEGELTVADETTPNALVFKIIYEA